jgi:hypothetical protein
MLKTVYAVLTCLFVVTFGIARAQETDSYSGELNDTTESRDYTISLNAGDAVLIKASAEENSDLDTYLSLYDPSNQLVAENDDAYIGNTNSRIAYVAEKGGDYRVTVTRYDNSTSGRYLLEITTGDTSILDYDVPLSGDTLTMDTEHFRFHYTLTGTDAVDMDYLEKIANAFEDARHIELDKLGWPEPPNDGTMGGDDRYDVYVMDVVGSADEALGIASPELFVGDNPSTPAVEEFAATSYISIDNDFDDLEFTGTQDEVTVMRSTAAHEYHHAIQFGFDGAEPHNWMAEATATWIETVVAGVDQDATDYVEVAFEVPEYCLGTTAEDNGVMYGEWTFMQFLTDEFGSDAVHQLWQYIADYEGFDALSKLTEAHDMTVPDLAARYRIKNLARDYKLAPLFNATVWLEDTITGTGMWTHSDLDEGVQELGASYFDFKPEPGIYDVELRGDARKLELWAIGVTSDDLQAIALGRGGGIDTRPYQKMYLMVFNPTYDNDVEECTSTDYRIRVETGKGTINPVDSVWNRTYFAALK